PNPCAQAPPTQRSSRTNQHTQAPKRRPNRPLCAGSPDPKKPQSPMFEVLVDTLRSLIIILALLTGMAYMTWFERRAISRLQIRIGPNRVGPTGLLQPVADALKLFFKEDIHPRNADRFLYPLAPGISLVAAL